LSIPIFSTGRPHRLHWPPSSARSSDGPTGVRKNMAICNIFSRCLIVASISRQRRQDGAFPLSIPIFSIEHPHLFHWPPPYPPFPLRNPGNFLPNDAAVKGIWGYTLVYQAELYEGVDPDSALKELLPTIRRLHSSDDLHPLDSLAEVKVSGGRLWPDRY
jgi:hypothetical protein